MNPKRKFTLNQQTHYILAVLILIISIFTINIPVQATTLDPGAGRLSGQSISSEFYDESDYETTFPINNYGSRKIKSPYTGAKYTHKTRFDDRTILHGIDVSRWQGSINWNKVKADGIDYAFIQVGFRGYGSSGILSDATKDPYFETNMQNAIAAGIKVGVYVFSQATNETEAMEEAEYILNAIGNYQISMPLVMDFEYASTDSGLGGRLYNAKLSKQQATDVCMAFCNEISAAGFTPMVYANKSMLEDQLNVDTLTDAGYRIWLANYTKETIYTGEFDFWQYSEKGSVNGINGDVDMNFYYAKPEDNFAPNPFSISTSIFTEVKDSIYTGEPITPEITVTHNGITLTPNVDYIVSYANNTKVGTATISITGIGNYCDVRNIRFDILPKAPVSLKAKTRAKNYITLSWKKDSSITGYEIYRATTVNDNYEKIKTINKKSTTTYKNTKLSAGKCYYYQMRSYKTINGKNYYSEFTPIESIYTKTGYTKNAITKSQIPVYDSIPGTKTEIVMVPDDSATTESTTENSTTAETATENATPENSTTETPTTTETFTENVITGNPATTDVTTENTPPENSADTTTTPSTDGDSTLDTPMKSVTVNVDSTALVNLTKKAKVNVIYSTTYKKKTWYYVSYKMDGVTYKGFVDSKKVTVTKLGKVIKTKQVNVRKKATANSKKLTTLKKNAKVDILKTKKKSGVTWYQVQFKKKNKTYTGWISGNYIKII